MASWSAVPTTVFRLKKQRATDQDKLESHPIAMGAPDVSWTPFYSSSAKDFESPKPDAVSFPRLLTVLAIIDIFKRSMSVNPAYISLEYTPLRHNYNLWLPAIIQ